MVHKYQVELILYHFMSYPEGCGGGGGACGVCLCGENFLSKLVQKVSNHVTFCFFSSKFRLLSGRNGAFIVLRESTENLLVKHLVDERSSDSDIGRDVFFSGKVINFVQA